jgi:TATA-binding protein-associated factor Taf7
VLVNGKKEMEMCDLLEVYSSSEKETLKRTHGVYMKESELARSIAATAAVEEAFQFVDMDTLRYQKIASQKVETIRLKAEQRTTGNNIIDQSAFYSDIESDDEDDDNDDARIESNNTNKNNRNNKSESKEHEEDESEEDESEEDESEEEESEEEESEEEESEEEEKQNTWNKNKRVYKEEIDVDDI